MSIVIALGVTTPETSYSDMAAGSDPESVEASPAVNEKNYNSHSCGSAQSHGYRGLPYTDHNYGAPPPPTPPASPLSQTIIPRMELNGGVAHGHRFRRRAGTEDNSADSDSSSSEDPENWCRCTLTADGLLNKCDNCRGVYWRKAPDGQHRKPENISVGESSATESGDEEVSPASVSYTATQHTPTSITLTVNRIKRNKSKKRKKSTEKARGTPKSKKVKAFREGSRKSMRMKNSTTEANVLDENTAEGWETKIRQWTDQYDEALANQYSADVQTLLESHCGADTKTESVATATAQQSKINTTTSATTHLSVDVDSIDHTEPASNNAVLSSQMQLQLGRVTRVQKNRKILRASKNLDAGTLIIEYRGKVMLKQQFEVNGHFFKKPYPFVLFYSEFDQVEMCVDARTFGNDARFIRRSCTPNAEVRHVIAEGMLHLCIHALGHITKDAEVTIAFDYEFHSCDYKVDCACHKGNQSCPVQKHNLRPKEDPSCPPSAPSSLTGAETRQRKARKKERGDGPATGATSDEGSQQPEPGEPHVASDTEDGLLDEVKLEQAEEGEVDENGPISSSKKALDSMEKRRRAMGAEDECVEPTDGAVNPSAGNTPAVCISTRRATYVMEPPSIEPEKTQTSSASGLAAPVAPTKPPPARSSKPRSKSRISRYRSSSSQRARRQRQALAQQAAAAAAAATAATDQATAPEEEGLHGPFNTELSAGECGLGAGHLLDPEVCLNRGNLRYPKTKKYLVTEWLNDKGPAGEKIQSEVPADGPLRITTDPTVLATTLNMLPGLSHTSYICTAPKHYVRFGSPFNPERHRPRPLQMDGTYGCYKKRWIKQAEDESCSASLEDGSESTSSHQSTSSRSTPNPTSHELLAPFKKRRAKYAAVPLPMQHLSRPLSPITPPLPEDPLHPLLGLPCGPLLLPNSLGYSPIPSLPTSRCNTPLQFENISSPEASPVHRPESISPEPCLRSDADGPQPLFQDLSLPSSSGSPAPTSEDFSLPVGPYGNDSQGLPASGGPAPPACPPSDLAPPPPGRDPAFRTEFNLIYTCSPLNANLGTAGSGEQRPSRAEGCFSPLEPSFGGVGIQGPPEEPGCMSPYGDSHYGAGDPYGESHYGAGDPGGGTSPHTGHPPVKKKVSLLEYRKRKQGSSREPDPGSSSSSSLGVVLGNQPGFHYSQDPYHPPPPAHPHPHQPPASPLSSFSSPAHASSSSTPHIEEVSPPQDSTSHWMVPTSVERLREGQGVLERVLRGGIKVDRILKKTDGDKEADGYDQQGPRCSPSRSPAHYSPSVFSQQSCESQRQMDSPSFHQQSSPSPFSGSYSPSSGQSFYSRLSQDHPPSSYPGHHHHHPTSWSDPLPPSGALHQQSNSSCSSSHLKASLLSSSSAVGSTTPGSRGSGQAKTDLASQACRLSQQQQGALQAGVRLLSSSSSPSGAPHYPPRHGATPSLAQFQHPPLQGSGVRTQSGSF